MLTSIAFVIAALVLAAAAFFRGRRIGHAKGLQEGRLAGWNEHAAMAHEEGMRRRATAIAAARPRRPLS